MKNKKIQLCVISLGVPVALSALSFVDVLFVEVCYFGVEMCLHVDRSVLGWNVRSAVITVKPVAVLAL